MAEAGGLRKLLIGLSENAELLRRFRHDREAVMNEYHLSHEERHLLRNQDDATQAMRAYFQNDPNWAGIFLFVLLLHFPKDKPKE